MEKQCILITTRTILINILQFREEFAINDLVRFAKMLNKEYPHIYIEVSSKDLSFALECNYHLFYREENILKRGEEFDSFFKNRSFINRTINYNFPEDLKKAIQLTVERFN